MEPRYNVQELVDKRVKFHKDAEAVLDVAYREKREMTAEETATYDRIRAAADGLNGTIERMEKSMAEERALTESRGRKTETTIAADKIDPAEHPKLVNDALKAWALRGIDGGMLRGNNFEPLAETRARFEKSAQKLGIDVATLTGFPSLESRALSVGTVGSGGYTVQNERMASLYEIQKWYGAVRAKAMVINTATAANLPVPVVSDTANSASITSEAGTVANNVDPTFTQIVVGTYKYVSPIVKVSIELLRDSSFDVAAFLNRILGVRLARKQNNSFTVGNGTTDAQGYITGATLGKTAAATNATTFDEVIDLEHSVDPAYRNGAEFMAHDLIIAALRKLKDSYGGYLWQPSMQAGVPALLHGIPITANNDMASTLATGNKILAYANFPLAYMIRDIGESMYLRSDQVYWATQEVGFLACQFSDAKVLDTTAIKYLALA